MYQESPRQQKEAPRQEVDWVYKKIEGRWHIVPVPAHSFFAPGSDKEAEERAKNTQQMLRETADQWKLDDPTVPHNEGILRDHPLYHDLFITWAKRYLEMKHFDLRPYSGRIDESEGNLLLPDGRFSNTWLTNVVARGREWIDENIEMELRIAEGFVDITHDEERQQQLGIEPQNEGWWAHDEV